MKFDIEEYIDQRIEEQIKLKTETYSWLKNVTKTMDELTIEEEAKILEKKMIFYSVSGALEELLRLKEVLNS